MPYPTNQRHRALEGAVTEQADLIGLRFRAKLQLSQHKRSLSALAGPYRASFRGRGMDFEEVRAYQPGDDVRSIDWRVTARTGTTHTKLYREERERPVYLIVDQRRNLFFGSQTRFKSVQAAEIAGLLAWSALKQNDRVGGLVLGRDLHEIRPKRSKSSVLKLLHHVHEENAALTESSSQAEPSLRAALEESRRLIKPGSAIFVVSDFHDFDEPCEALLFQLAKHNEVAAFRVFDPLERELPPAGLYKVKSGSKHGMLNTRKRQTRDDYEAQYEQRQTALKERVARIGVPLVPIATSDDALNQLLKYYAFQRGTL